MPIIFATNGGEMKIKWGIEGCYGDGGYRNPKTLTLEIPDEEFEGQDEFQINCIIQNWVEEELARMSVWWQKS
jgi:hypothetical protein